MSKTPEPLGQVQLEILRYVAEHHPIRVSDVAEYFAQTAGKARTTVLTVLEKLREKGYLSRRKLNGAFHYAPRLGQDQVLASVVQRFVDETLGGSVSPFIAFLADSPQLTDAELAKLKSLVSKLEVRRQTEKP
ncbi:MAG: BlaI/MecI/CopY family transcriptional regulator [Planctomycetota bacterium]|nr:BlaI/MecI/CopY family transcriptional regulator [Planctomycetota bacterium]